MRFFARKILRVAVAAAIVAVSVGGADIAGRHTGHEGAPFQIAGVEAASTSAIGIGCKLSHSQPDDPIVFPGQTGASHRHDFFGNTETDAFSTASTLRAGQTSCNHPGDASGYWAPSLLLNGKRIIPDHMRVYYKRGTYKDVTLKPFPAGLKMIAGSAHSMTHQPLSIVSWRCSDSNMAPRSTPPTCTGSSRISVNVNFPSCWDGKNLDSGNHMSHMAYPTKGLCPSTHPVYVPKITINLRTPLRDPTGLAFSSGSTDTFHADFFNGWKRTALAKLVSRLQ